MHERLNVDLLAERRAFHIAAFMYKVIKGLIQDVSVRTMFHSLEYVHDLGTRARNRCDLVVQEVRTNFGARAISVFGSRIFNLIPVNVRNSNSLNIFTSNYWKLNKSK